MRPRASSGTRLGVKIPCSFDDIDLSSWYRWRRIDQSKPLSRRGGIILRQRVDDLRTIGWYEADLLAQLFFESGQFARGRGVGGGEDEQVVDQADRDDLMLARGFRGNAFKR